MLRTILESLHRRIQFLEQQTYLVDIIGDRKGDYHVEPFDYENGFVAGCLQLSPTPTQFWFVVVLGKGELNIEKLNERLQSDKNFRDFVLTKTMPVADTKQLKFEPNNPKYGVCPVKMKSLPAFVAAERQYVSQDKDFQFGFA